MRYQIATAGISRSFPAAHDFLDGASSNGTGLMIIGDEAGSYFAALDNRERFEFIAIELGQECLGAHTGESLAAGPSNIVGFARFRLGTAEPSNLVEIVRQANTVPAALAAARAAFEAAKLVAAVCADFPGRIVNRLIRPYFNAALRRFDEGLASAADLDKTLCLGLGYPEGPLSLLERTGLSDHYDVTRSLYEALGQEAYAPARRAGVAHAIRHRR